MRLLAVGLLGVVLAAGTSHRAAHAGRDRDAEVVQACTRALDVLTTELLAPAPKATGPGGIVNAAGDGRRLMAQAFTLLALRAHPETARWAEARAKLEREMRAFVAGGLAVQDTWPLGVIGLDLAEQARRGELDRELAAEVAYRIESSQNAEGGWSHGRALTAVDFYPSTLVAATNGCVAALALLGQAGVEVDGRALEQAVGLYRAVQGAPGAFPYGGRAYRKGYEAGRTAGAVFALAAAGVQGPVLHRAARYVTQHAADIPRGHASAAYHVFYGALGCAVVGGGAQETFRRQVLDPLLERQMPSGHFPGAHPSPDEMALMGSDVDRRGYITAATTAALLAPRLRLLDGLRLEDVPPAGPSRAAAPEPAPLAVRWERPVRPSALLRHGPWLLVADARRPGRLEALDPATGEPAWQIDNPRVGDHGGHTLALLAGGPQHVVALHRHVAGRAMPVRVAGMTVNTPTVRTWIARHALADGRALWTREIEGDVLDVQADGTRVMLLHRGGRVVVLDAEAGTPRHEGKLDRAVVNGAACGLPGGTAAAGEARLAVWNDDGSLRWRRRGRARRGLVPPAYGPVAFVAGHLVTTRTDGRIEGLDVESGGRAWTVETPSAPWAAVPLAGAYAVLGYDGTLHVVDARAGTLRWRRPVPRTAEALGDPRLAAFGDHVACTVPGSRLAWWFDGLGEVVGTAEAGRAAALAVDGDALYVGDDGGLVAHGPEAR